MKTVMLLVIICFLQLTCKSQDDEKNNTFINNQKLTKMKTLNQDIINIYKAYEKQEYVKNDTIFKLKEYDDVYLTTTKSVNNNFIVRTIYDKKTLKLKREGISFINMPVGIHKFYDENGNLLKETDFDQGFNFTVDNLISKFKKDLKIDLNSEIEGLTIGRGIKNYYIRIPQSPTEYSEYKYREILIDGTNGSIMSDKIITTRED